jgi:hypothetical protein
MGIAVLETCQTHARQPLASQVARLRFRRTAQEGSEKNVVQCRFPGQQRVHLEHVATVSIDRRDWPSAGAYGAGGGREQARNQVQQRRFAAAGGTDHSDKLAVGNFEGDVLYGGKPAIEDRHTLQLEHDGSMRQSCRAISSTSVAPSVAT